MTAKQERRVGIFILILHHGAAERNSKMEQVKGRKGAASSYLAQSKDSFQGLSRYSKSAGTGE
jgi:hypothetical protein